MENKKLALMDAVLEFNRRRKVSHVGGTLNEIDSQVDWRDLAEIVSVLDKSMAGGQARAVAGGEFLDLDQIRTHRQRRGRQVFVCWPHESIMRKI